MKTRSITPERALLSRAIVGPGGRKSGAVLIAGGKIVDIVGRDEVPADCSSEDFGDLVVSPGLVDSHVHINEPGRTEWEGFETATRAAAAGGITTLIDMPLNSTPVTTNDIALQAKVNAANGQCWVDYGFYGGLVPGNVAGLRSLIDAGVLGIKAFLIHSGIDDFPNVTEADLRTAMPVIAQSGIPLLVHAELNTGSNLKKSDSPRSYAEYLDSRPRAWENKAIELMTRLSREFNCRVHIVHLSSSDAIPRLKQARQSGLPITVETCPHYLVFSSECIRDGDTRFKCAPPIRENENRKLLWGGLRDSVIDFIVSDHSPCPPELKEIEAGDFQRAWGGISSLQFGLPAVWTEAREQGLGSDDLSRWMSAGPAAFLGLHGRKGAIARDHDADLVVWDPEERFTVVAEMIHHRHKVTPYEGKNLYGKVRATFLRGEKVFHDGKFGRPMGRLLTRSYSAEQV